MRSDIADVLHVNTGGGKSETYFGMLVFLLFWDRLQGKTVGTSAIVKFPLRMLSIQQIQRIAKIICWAERVRIQHNINGEPFSLGYFVGVSKEFPRSSYDEISKVKSKKIRGILLDECPFCSKEVIKYYDAPKFRIIHKCTQCNELFYLYYINEEIYRFIPSIIISTVDKLASVASNRRLRSILGARLVKCPDGHGYVPYNEKCEFSLSKRKKCNKTSIQNPIKPLPPRLMIQDELHLLKEGFGTIDSHFESLINTIIQHNSNQSLKYIAMSATIKGVDEQIIQLYGKSTEIFPGISPEFGTSQDFFFERVLKPNSTDPLLHRYIIGLKPNLRENQYASLITIYHISQFISQIQQNLSFYASKYKCAINRNF